MDESEQAVLEAADAIRGKKHAHNNVRINGGGGESDLDTDAVTALEEFSFLDKNPLNETVISLNASSNRQTNSEEWNVDPKQIQKMTEIYKSEKGRKRTSSTSSTETADSNMGG